MSVPYENATSGAAARKEIVNILQRFGCEKVGFMDEFVDKAVLLAFVHRGRPVQMRASGKGWAALWLKENPWSYKRKLKREAWEKKAVDQGMVAVNSVLRDWIKGQMTAVECGMQDFETVFMPYMLLPDGRSLIEHVRDAKLLPPPNDEPSSG